MFNVVDLWMHKSARKTMRRADPQDAALQAYDRSLVRLRGTGAATNFALSDYRADLADYHKMQQVTHRVRGACCSPCLRGPSGRDAPATRCSVPSGVGCNMSAQMQTACDMRCGARAEGAAG